jgi:hypothetical protein
VGIHNETVKGIEMQVEINRRKEQSVRCLENLVAGIRAETKE